MELVQSSQWRERVRKGKVRKCNNTWVDKKYEHASRKVRGARKEKNQLTRRRGKAVCHPECIAVPILPGPLYCSA